MVKEMLKVLCGNFQSSAAQMTAETLEAEQMCWMHFSSLIKKDFFLEIFLKQEWQEFVLNQMHMCWYSLTED